MVVGLLHLHNFARWLVLLAALVAIGIAIHALVTRQPWTRAARLSGVAYVIIMDVQLLVGLVLYAVSPVVRAGLADVGAGMGDTVIRFFLVEHLLLMVLAVAAAHVGSVTIRRAATDRAKYTRAATWFSVSFLLVLIAIPWWRPLFPGL